MKQIRLIIVLVSLIIFSGCTVETNIKIKSNGKVEEKGIVVSKFKVKKSKEIEKNLNENYNEVLKKYKHKYYFKDNLKVKFNKKNSNLKQFLKTSNINLMFENYELFENDNTVNFYNIDGLKYPLLFNFQDDIKETYLSELVDKIIINIQFENKVIDSNADKVDTKTNTYTWFFDKTTIDKNISFSYDKTQKSIINNKINYNTLILIIISTLLLIIIVIKLYGKKNSV